MDYDTLSKGNYPEVKPRRKLRLVAFLILAAVLQLSAFYGFERLLSGRNSIDPEPTKVTEVQQRMLSLLPSPDSPGILAVSPDHQRLAVVDINQLKIFDLTDGREIYRQDLGKDIPGALQWLPDRNRLIFALMNSRITTEVIKEPVSPPGVKDEIYSNDLYRTKTITKEGFQINLYSLDGQENAEPELIQTLHQGGAVPEKLDLSLSTYTNLLYVHWVQQQRDNLVQVDIMKRIKDINLPRGEMTRLIVTPRNGDLFVEMSSDNGPAIYKHQKNRWKLQKQLDGYRLLGVTPEDQLAVTPDQGNMVREVEMVDEKGDFKPGWAFSTPLPIDDVSILKDGRLIYFAKDKVIIHTPQLGNGTVFNIEEVDSYSPDGKFMVSWQESEGKLKILEEVEGSK